MGFPFEDLWNTLISKGGTYMGGKNDAKKSWLLEWRQVGMSFIYPLVTLTHPPTKIKHFDGIHQAAGGMIPGMTAWLVAQPHQWFEKQVLYS